LRIPFRIGFPCILTSSLPIFPPMSLIVQKFGGTSVADCEKIRAAARKAVRAHQQGHHVVVVVSAMGKNTDQLIALAREVNPRPPAREMDMLLSTGTLGRGGSDTTAVALAAVLGADLCEIYTDVDGVYTTDPRVLPEARQMVRISYDEMLELASLGAGVMHNRSIEFAKKFHVPIHVRSSLSDAEGTLIVEEPESRELPVCGAALTLNEARITLLGVPDVPGTSYEVFSRIAARKISVDMLVQNVGASGKADACSRRWRMPESISR